MGSLQQACQLCVLNLGCLRHQDRQVHPRHLLAQHVDSALFLRCNRRNGSIAGWCAGERAIAVHPTSRHLDGTRLDGTPCCTHCLRQQRTVRQLKRLRIHRRTAARYHCTGPCRAAALS